MASLPDTIIPCCSSYRRNGTVPLKNTTDDSNGVKKIKSPIAGDILPEEIMMLVLSKLDLVSFHRFSAVCKSWQSIAIAIKNIRHMNYLRPQLPWLMLSSSSSEDHHHHGFLNLCHGKVFKLELPEVLIDAQCCGSNWGWLIMVVRIKGGSHFLWNPFTKIVIELPPKATLPFPHGNALFKSRLVGMESKFSHKAILLSPPAAAAVGAMPRDGCVVVHYKYFLAFCRAGDDRWTPIRYSCKFEDIICYNGKLYGITDCFNLILVELDLHPQGERCCGPCGTPPLPREEVLIPRSFYLVECLGELLTVIRCVSSESYLETCLFKIYKLDPNGLSWIEVKDLGDQMLFVGTSTAISLSTVDHPGFRGNCIYFTDDYAHKYGQDFHDLGVFHLEDNSIEPSFSNYSHFSMPLHIWFTPVSW